MAKFTVYEEVQVEVTTSQIEEAKSRFEQAIELGEISSVFECEDIELVFEETATKLWCSYVVEGHGPIFEVCIE